MQKLLFLPLIICFSTLISSAQNKSAFHASLFYPTSIGNNYINDAYRDVMGVKLSYQYFPSSKFSFGPSYSSSLHNQKINITDATGNILQKDLITLFLHDFDLSGAYFINPSDKWQVSLSLAVGYTLMNSGINDPAFGKSRSSAGGFNITPSVELSRRICNHFNLFTCLDYSYKHLKNANLQSIDPGLGASLSF